MRKCKTFANSAAGPWSEFKMFPAELRSWARGGHIERKLTKTVTLHVVELASSAKVFSQVKDVSYWESFSPVVSFTTIRLLIALTAMPHWHVMHYDVSVAFITAKIDPTHPPIYCRPAEGYESRTEYVYLLHRYLYGMKDSPRHFHYIPEWMAAFAWTAPTLYEGNIVGCASLLPRPPAPAHLVIFSVFPCISFS